MAQDEVTPDGFIDPSTQAFLETSERIKETADSLLELSRVTAQINDAFLKLSDDIIQHAGSVLKDISDESDGVDFAGGTGLDPSGASDGADSWNK